MYALLGFVLGISFFYYLKSLGLLIVLFSLLSFTIASLRRDKKLTLILYSCLVVGLAYQYLKSVPTPNLGENTYSGFVVESKSNYFLFKSERVTYYVYEKDNTREPGDYLIVEGIGEPYISTEYESRFSFTEYLSKKGVHNKITPKSIEVRWERPIRLREKEKKFLSFYDKETAGLIDSLLFDHRDYSLSNINLADEIGVLYFLSASGMIFGAIIRFIDYLLHFKLDGTKKEWMGIAISTFFIPFNIYKPGVIRVYLSKIFKAVQMDEEDRLDHIDVTCLTGLLMIGFAPSLALNTGFLLSLAVSILMVLLLREIAHFKKDKRTVLGFLLSVSLIFPILVSGNEFHLLSPLYSVVVLPLIYPFIFLSWLSYLTVPMMSVLNGYSLFIAGMLETIAKVDITIPIGDWSPLIITMYYTLYINIWYWHDIGLTHIRDYCLVALACILLLNPIPYSWGFKEAVYFINVGQGDSIVIKSRNATVMIDTGGNTSFDIANEVLIPFLRKERIYKIDYLITTHHDEDHDGGVESLNRKYKVKNIIDYNYSFPLSVGDINLDNLNVYWNEESDENDKSLVLYSEFMKKKWLFMGDAPTSIEESILLDHPDLDCDIIKVGHHGSDTSSSFEFVKAITPSEAVISVGAKNKYGHPMDSVLNIYAHFGVKIRRTDEEGTISYIRYVSPLRLK